MCKRNIKTMLLLSILCLLVNVGGNTSVAMAKPTDSYILYHEAYNQDPLLMITDLGTERLKYNLNGYGVFSPSGEHYAYVIPIKSTTEKTRKGDMKTIGGIIRIASVDGESDVEVFRINTGGRIPTQLRWAPNNAGLYFRYLTVDKELPPQQFIYLDMVDWRVVNKTAHIEIKCESPYSVNPIDGRIAYITQELKKITGRNFLITETIIASASNGTEATVIAGPQIKTAEITSSAGGDFKTTQIYSNITWSHDGKKIAYCMQEGSQSVLYVGAYPDYSDRVKLAEDVVGNVVWSPDDSKLAYGSTEEISDGQPASSRNVIMAVASSGKEMPRKIANGILETWVKNLWNL